MHIVSRGQIINRGDYTWHSKGLCTEGTIYPWNFTVLYCLPTEGGG